VHSRNDANPTKREFAGMVCEKLLTNFPITIRNIGNANQNCWPKFSNLRDKTTSAKPDNFKVVYARILKDFIKIHKYVVLVADVMFVNNLPFLVTSLQDIRLVTIEHLPQTAKRLVNTLKWVSRIHGPAGFVAQTAMMVWNLKSLNPVASHHIEYYSIQRAHWWDQAKDQSDQREG
jgi:hypothetical protein